MREDTKDFVVFWVFFTLLVLFVSTFTHVVLHASTDASVFGFIVSMVAGYALIGSRTPKLSKNVELKSSPTHAHYFDEKHPAYRYDEKNDRDLYKCVCDEFVHVSEFNEKFDGKRWVKR